MNNRYCERLGIGTPPCVDDYTDRRDRVGRPLTLANRMILALLEAGEPLPDLDLAVRLLAAGVDSPCGDMLTSIRKAWHGIPPIVRDPDGRLALDLSWGDWDLRLWVLGLREHEAPVVPAPPPPAVESPPREGPLSAEEVDDAFRDASLWAFSQIRLAAAVLDAAARPLTLAEIEATLAALSRYRPQVTDRALRTARGGLVRALPDGRFAIDPASPALRPMREAVRALAGRTRVHRAAKAHSASISRACAARRETQEARDAARFAGLRRALVRAVPEPDAPSAIAILDLQDRTFRTLFGADMARLGGILAGYDVVAALRPRATLFALGLDPDARHLVDLSPPQKSRTINRQGRKLAISPELLITSSTGISDPLGDPARIARYLADGDRPRLARRLESDLKSLAAFWRYASLHRAVRLRWGFLDEWIGTDWALPGEPSLYDILKDAQATGAEVEVVCGTAPGWTDPWARALRGRVVRVEMWVFEIETRDGVGVIDRGEVQAVRGVG